MFYRGWWIVLLAWVALGCSESPRDLTEGTLENAGSAGQRTLGPMDDSTDPAVSLIDADAGTTATQSDEGVQAPPTMPPAQEPPPAMPDAGPAATDDDHDSGSGGSAGQGTAGSAGMMMTEPEPPPDDADNGGLVGTVCDLLGGLLCPVGLLCVDGSCQLPESS